VPAPYQPHTTRPYLANRTYRENAGALTPPEGASGGLADQARPLAAGTRYDLGRLADIRVPDSAAAAEAERLARAESSTMLYGHALRSYFYAALLAARDGMRYDEELLYVGCVLHDIGAHAALC
jgi:hypothetical protein